MRTTKSCGGSLAAVAGLLISAFYVTTLLDPPIALAELAEGIAWYGVLEDGLEEAVLTGKPILMTSAAPQCTAVSGMW